MKISTSKFFIALLTFALLMNGCKEDPAYEDDESRQDRLKLKKEDSNSNTASNGRDTSKVYGDPSTIKK